MVLINSVAIAQPPQKPLRRADRFFGLHFDFHATRSDLTIGQTLTEGMIDTLLNRVKPDFIQVDTKGHVGVTSYPTKVGYAFSQFTFDPLKRFRDVTNRHGVALYVHHSGVWDNEAVLHHPGWARHRPDGKLDTEKTSVFGAYADSLLIPQLKEIADYGVDGVWTDGECWGTELDYGPTALAAFRQATGIQDVPKKKGEPHFDDFVEFNRKAFLKYVGHYVDEVHKYKPSFQIASNWAYSSFMPEPVNTNVDFISGDLSSTNAANSAAFEARCIAPQGKPWDLMAWSFASNYDGIHAPKPARQLCQEAAQVLAMGGGFQAYFTQNRDASIKLWEMPVMEELARFCRERQAYCYKTEAVPQVALLYSTTGYKHISSNIYRPWNGEHNAMRGILDLLLYNQLPTEILMEHHLRGKMQQYPLIVIPEWSALDPVFRDELIQYARNGGNLLVIGSDAVLNFREVLGVTLADTIKNAFFGLPNHITGTAALNRIFTPLAGTKTVGGMYKSSDMRDYFGPAASVSALGKGKIAAIYLNIGSQNQQRQTVQCRDFLAAVVQEVLPKPAVQVHGSKKVQLAVNQKDKKLLVNVINMTGSHANKAVHTSDDIVPIGPLTVSVRRLQKPKQVTLQPGNQPVSFHYKNDEVSFIIPKLDIHLVAVIE
ncbi:hypothetical protein EHT25_11270 [Larkinella rosea]|uniref:Beta-galactosidase trimerisation domain-containing protein n=1 Tax=Larkinella rosea TaxID=2025312 RepID=A0A3P1BVF2_9BACT|nr:hypothetical protein EHT25_11270 [Larkinella rosea]